MKRMVAAALLLAAPAAAAAATPDPTCALLERIAASAAEPRPFASLAGARLDALLGAHCRLGAPAPRTFLCTRSLAPEPVSAEALVARIQLCLPGAEIVARPRWDRDTRLRHGALVIDVSENGGPRAKVGRIVSLYFSTVATPHP